MAALAIRFHRLPNNFLTCFPRELPFSWETVPFTAWHEAIEQLKQQCHEQFVAGSDTIFKIHVERSIDEMTQRHQALNSLLGLLRAVALRSDPPEIRALQHPNALSALDGMLFSGDQSLLQRLLRNNADTNNGTIQWPTAFNLRVSEARRNSLLGSLLCSINDYRDGLINLPILLAIQAATNDTKEWFESSDMIHDLRTHIAFDQDWFTEAYNLTTARCLSMGLLKLEIES
jgi:hypothetical protein